MAGGGPALSTGSVVTVSSLPEDVTCSSEITGRVGAEDCRSMDVSELCVLDCGPIALWKGNSVARGAEREVMNVKLSEHSFSSVYRHAY